MALAGIWRCAATIGGREHRHEKGATPKLPTPRETSRFPDVATASKWPMPVEALRLLGNSWDRFARKRWPRACVSCRAGPDLTLTQLSGHLEAGSGNLEIVDAPGNLNVRTHDEDINIENAGGKVKIDDRNGNINVRFSSPPKDDVEIYSASAPYYADLARIVELRDPGRLPFG